ncbi:LINE-1 reverse transcriptase isogeny [Gossypium australe]|uniref:LINE-1 reverse transcriptase isogeny n=1 Tax=Gossypium australe TaxID=47621 RepID=A0A5B6X0S6_9ROSI|nr:LINE-1 reverse transcriptase isogeny [Gossypium australe]
MLLAEREGIVKGARVNDSILFGEASNQGAQTFKIILQENEEASGHCVNYEKSTIFYSTNTTDQIRSSITQLWNVRSSFNLERYLCLPNMVGWGKKLAFQGLKDRKKQKIANWSTKFLSQ